MPNVFVASFTYDLPFGKGRRFKPPGITGKLLQGWEVAGVVTLQSGLPLAVTQATNFNAFAGYGTQRPDRISEPNLPTSQQTTAQFFNTSAFTIAPQFTLGNSSRNPVRGSPGFGSITSAGDPRVIQFGLKLSF